MSLPEAASFAVAFVTGMRKARWLRYQPTVRTAVALSRLLVVRRLRVGRLTGEDYLSCAQLVTPPEDQDAALDVALSVLSAPVRLPVGAYASNAETKAAASIAAEMELATAVESAQTPQQLQQNLEDLLTDEDFRAFLEEMGGVEAAKARFENPDALKEHGRQMIREQMGGLSQSTFALAAKLGMTGQIAEKSTSAAERLAAKALLGELLVEDALDQVDAFDLKKKTLELMAGARIEVQDSLQSLADSASTLAQLADVSVMGTVKIDRKTLLQALARAVPHSHFEELFEQTESFTSELAAAARESLYQKYEDLTEQQLSDHAHLCAQWHDALQRAVNNRGEQAKAAGFDEGMSLLRDLYTVARRQGDPVLSQHLTEGIAGAAKGVLEQVTDLDQLLELINATDAMGAPLPPDLIREQGYQLGLSPSEMDQILHSRLALVKRMIEQGEKVYERFARLIDKERPGMEQTRRLAELAIRKANAPALAALGNYNLNWTLKAADDLNDGHELIVESLSAGPGSNLLTQWFLHKDKVPEKIHRKLRLLAREVLVQYAVSLGKAMIGDRSRGILEGEAVRAYVPGDDAGLIDMEETVDHIVSQGKPTTMIGSEDFQIRETVHGRRAVAMLVDISGSMQGEKLTWCAIAAAMLAYALSPEELSLAFFESDTHVVKSFADRMEIDEIADQLLSLTSQGGTMMGRAMDWLARELRDVGPRRKNALVLTDAAIYDLEDCSGSCRLLSAMQVSTSWFVPQSQWAQSEAKSLAKWSRGTVVRLHGNWRRFPALISEALH